MKNQLIIIIINFKRGYSVESALMKVKRLLYSIGESGAALWWS